MTLTLTLDRATPSLNEFANIRRTNAWTYRRLRAAWNVAIGQALLEARSHDRRPLAWPRPPHERVLVRVIRYAPAHHWLDPDNLTGGLKPVLDGLKAHELVDNDTARDIDLEVRQAVSETNLAGGPRSGSASTRPRRARCTHERSDHATRRRAGSSLRCEAEARSSRVSRLERRI